MPLTARTLMVQGTSSSAGKSLLVTALCRIFARRGLRVAPFKGQNMSNNAAVCADGSEIGRSQALQAAAAYLAPTAEMNPVLLKPEADSRSQVVVQGRPWRTLDARAYYRQREQLWPIVTACLDRLRDEYDLVVIEGAGSPAELNLLRVDMVNMNVARYCEAPVLLVGDIDRGGVFAQLLGTLWLLSDEERRLVRGLIVNKFRGDRSLFDSGVTILEERGRVPVLGVVPWLSDLNLPEEDGQSLESSSAGRPAADELDIAVIQFPRIANFDDFDPLQAEAGVCLRYVRSPEQLGRPAAIILPGTKSTMADLQWLQTSGLAERILQLRQQGTVVVGICGGYQMLGRQILDPDHVESACSQVSGLGLLPTKTVFSRTKATNQVRAVVQDDRHCRGCRGLTVTGYEIHMGQTTSNAPWLELCERGQMPLAVGDGAVSDDGRVWGCYLHGLFANDGFRSAWLSTLRRAGAYTRDESFTPAESLDVKLDRMADRVEAALDMHRLTEIIGEPKARLCPTT